MARKNATKTRFTIAKSPKKAYKTATKIKRARKLKLVPVKVKRFRDKKSGHPHVIVDKVDNKNVSVGLTHSAKKGKNSTNYKLEKDPLRGNEQSYMRRQGTVAHVNNYDKPKRGIMTPKDYTVAKKYGKRAKEKYINKKNSDIAKHV